MTLLIVFTPKAKETFLLTGLLIKEKWGEVAANDFVERSRKVLTQFLCNLIFLSLLWI